MFEEQYESLGVSVISEKGYSGLIIWFTNRSIENNGSVMCFFEANILPSIARGIADAKRVTSAGEVK